MLQLRGNGEAGWIAPVGASANWNELLFKEQKQLWEPNRQLLLDRLPTCERAEHWLGVLSVGYALCEIANDPCLEVVKVGVLAEPGWSFHQGTLRMRSVFTWLYSSADLSKLKTLLIGSEVLKKYTSAVFESEFLRGD